MYLLIRIGKFNTRFRRKNGPKIELERNIDGSPAAYILENYEFRKTENKRMYNYSDLEINKSLLVNIKC